MTREAGKVALSAGTHWPYHDTGQGRSDRRPDMTVAPAYHDGMKLNLSPIEGVLALLGGIAVLTGLVWSFADIENNGGTGDAPVGAVVAMIVGGLVAVVTLIQAIEWPGQKRRRQEFETQLREYEDGTRDTLPGR